MPEKKTTGSKPVQDTKKKFTHYDKRLKNYMCGHHRKGSLMAMGVGAAVGAGLTAAALWNRR